MGLLSDPSLTPRNKFGRNLAKHSKKICLFFYAAGLVWFVALSHTDFNHNTYLSENALSPGLVYPEVKQDSSRLAQSMLEELQRERAEYKSTTPFAWIVAKMKQIGLETHIHNYTLRYPFAGGKEYHGNNIYGVLRAPRIGSTEGIVFSAPYRAPSSVHTDISASVPLLLAFADFARRKNYWAKDLVFLVTEQEQLGIHAWLEAYYGGGVADSSILDFGDLPARAGALQAALNLEIQDLDIDYIDVKIEGLNGQLPNLDMFNLVQRIASREGISSGYKQSPRKKRRSSHLSMEDNLSHIVSMLMTQATGVPNGNHGLYHRYRIEALTLEAVKRNTNPHSNASRNSAALSLLKTIEGISRSLNNLLERFHQSYFFYILVQNDRFVSIGDFIPALILLASPMFMRAFLLWLVVDGNETDDSPVNYEVVEEYTPKTEAAQLPYGAVILYISIALLLGVLCSIIPQNQFVHENLSGLGLNTPTVTTILLLNIILMSMLLPYVVSLPQEGVVLLHIATLIFFGVALIVVGLLNFALGFIIAILSTPLAVCLSSSNNHRLSRPMLRLYTLALHPLVVVSAIVFVFTLFQFTELPLADIAVRAITATMDAITYSLVDNMIYGNWLYTAVTTVFFPLWTLCWTVAVSRSHSVPGLKLKTN